MEGMEDKTSQGGCPPITGDNVNSKSQKEGESNSNLRVSSRVPLKPLNVLRTSLDEATSHFDDLINSVPKLENIEKSVQLAENIKMIKEGIISQSEYLQSRLAESGLIAESKEVKVVKNRIIYDSYKALRDINKRRKIENLDILSNFTPRERNEDDVTSGYEFHDAGLNQTDHTHINPNEVNFENKLPDNFQALHFPNNNSNVNSAYNQIPTPVLDNPLDNLSYRAPPPMAPQIDNFFNQPRFQSMVNSHQCGTLPQYVHQNYVPQFSTVRRNQPNYNPPPNLNQSMTGPLPTYVQNDAATNYLLKQNLFNVPQTTFGGKNQNFFNWSSALKSRMSGVNLTSSEKLQILFLNTSDRPRDIINDYIEAAGENISDSTVDLVWSVLKERYGLPSHGFSYIEQRVKDFPPIKSLNQSEDIARLLDLSRLIFQKSLEIPELYRYNLSEGMSLLWAKLPSSLLPRWRTYAVKVKNQNDGRNPTLPVFISFLEMVYKEVSDTFFSSTFTKLTIGSFKPKVLSTALVQQNPSDNEQNEQNTTSLSESSTARNDEKVVNIKCPIHNTDSHSITTCRKFKSSSLTERKKIVFENGLCFKCFDKHLVKNCKAKIKCDFCGRRHNTFLHDDNFKPAKYEKSENVTNMCTEICDGSKAKVFSKTLLVNLKHKDDPTKIMTLYVIVDEQSTNTFIDPAIIKFLHFPTSDHSYSLRTLDGLSSVVHGKIAKGLQVKGFYQNEWHNCPPAFTHECIPDSRDQVASPTIVRSHASIAHLHHHFHEAKTNIPVLMIIGADAGHLMHSKCYGKTPPYVHQTPIGWAVVGNACKDIHYEQLTSMKVCRTSIESLSKSFSSTMNFIDKNPLETDIFRENMDDELPGLSKDEQRFNHIVEEGVTIEEGTSKIKMPLPFKDGYPIMPNNQQAVFHRTKNSLNKLAQDPKKLQDCLKSMEKTIQKEHVELVPQNQHIPNNKDHVWFLPVFPVTHPKKGKARVVFDASAKYQGKSLNDVLLQGPTLMNNLRNVLQRFRENPIGIICDVEHMFYNFSLEEMDKDYTRFFWYQDNHPEKPLVQYRAKVHIFGAKSSPAIAASGLRIAAMRSTVPEKGSAVKAINRHFYVDDCLVSVSTAEEASHLVFTLREVLNEFNIRIHKFASSHPEVLKNLPKEEIAEGLSCHNFIESTEQRTLGVEWDVVSDCFILRAKIPNTPFTKRGVLSAINSFYDPIGMGAPVVLAGRLCQRKVIPPKDKENDDLRACDWDTPLPERYLDSWSTWKKSLQDVHMLKIPRCYTPQTSNKIVNRSLHIFGDASEEAIGVVMYLRSVDDNEAVHVSFVTGLSRVAPRSATSIPRLELCASLLAVSSANEQLREMDMKINDAFYYTDSLVTLGYINNQSKSFSRYVTRRVDLILKTTTNKQWNYIPTHSNPADLASRPSTVAQLIDSCWLTGPDFLMKEPLCLYRSPNEPESLPETRVLKTAVSSKKGFLFLLASRLNNWHKLLKVLTFCFKFISNLAARTGTAPLNGSLLKKEPTTERAVIARMVKLAQEESYPDVVMSLKAGKYLPQTHKLTDLAPFIDSEGLVHVGGRIKNSDSPFDVKHPVLLPADHPVSNLIVQDIHLRTGHQGRVITHANIRQRGYHLEKGRKFIGDMLSKCIICKKLRAQPNVQIMADLPRERIETSPPFSSCGIDVFGPFVVHDGVNTRRNSAGKKMYVLILTCMVSRAVHLEPLPSMDTPSFINALRRFFAIRGVCVRIQSDHGSNFIGAINQADKIHVDLHCIEEEAKLHNCEWKLNPPGASHFGGVWERKIGAIRRVLEHSFLQSKNRLLSRDEMHTLLQEAAAIVNSTPLTSVSTDPNDPAPISPAQLLTLKDQPHPPPIETYPETDLLRYGAKRWRRVQYLADQFWTRWRQEYLTDLQKRVKWTTPKRNMKSGDLVLIKNKTAPRCNWPTGIIDSVTIASDGFVRRAVIRVSGKRGKFERAIHDLVLLCEVENL